jgi:hypothetical protein
MGRFYVWAALRHKMCSGGGTNTTIDPVPFRIRIDLMGDWEGRDWRGDITINCGWRRQRVGDTTIILWAASQLQSIQVGYSIPVFCCISYIIAWYIVPITGIGHSARTAMQQESHDRRTSFNVPHKKVGLLLNSWLYFN